MLLKWKCAWTFEAVHTILSYPLILSPVLQAGKISGN